MAGERWFFTPEQLENTPSRKCGIDSDKETYYKQQAANFIQDMGQRLQVTQLCINTAIVYLHRFYMFHPFTKFHRNNMAEACLFLAAKVEEQPRKLEHVIKVAHMILHRDQGPLDTKGIAYLEHAQELVVNENILLQSLGFELQVDHPHTHIVKTCDLIRAAKDLAQTSYFLATNSLHLTQMSLQYKPTFVACVCIHLACKWAQFEIPRSDEGKEWFFYVDKTMTAEILEELTQNFLAILDKCPSKFKKKLMSKSAKDEDLLAMLGGPPEKKVKREAPAASTSDKGVSLNNHEPKTKLDLGSPVIKVEQKASPAVAVKQEVPPKAGQSSSESALRRVKTDSCLTSLTTKEYFEKREREKQERERIERERQRIVSAEKGSSRAGAAQGRDSDKVKSLGDKSHVTSHQGRQHTNIFEQMASNQIKPEPVSDTDSTDPPAQPKDKHSLDRSLVQHSYKDKYHEKERPSSDRPSSDRPSTERPSTDRPSDRPSTERPSERPSDRAASDRPSQPRKLPFSVDHNKLRDEQRSKTSSHRYHEHRPESNREPAASSRHPYDPKYKGHRGHAEYRTQEHRPPHPPKELQRHEAHRLPNPDIHVHTKPAIPEPVSKPPVEAAPVPTVDPEEGEILDDDSPSLPDPKEDLKKSHSHPHRHHSRERRSSGHRHHSPGAAIPPAVHPERETPQNVQDTRTRRKSPRNGRPAKEEAREPHQQHSASAASHRERKSSGPRYDAAVPDPVVPDKVPELAVLHNKALEEVSVSSQRGTPEPGEIVEHAHKHGHHKSSHSKSHKRDKHRDRDALQASESSSSGSLKIKLDLKGMGKVPTPTKHASPATPAGATQGEEKKKELKLKIKPPPLSVDSRDGLDSTASSGVHGAKDVPSAYKLKETPAGQKVKEATLSQNVKDLPTGYKVKEASSSKVKDTPPSHKLKDHPSGAKGKDLPAAYKKDIAPSLKVKLKLPSSSSVSGNGETPQAKSENKDLSPGGSKVGEPKAAGSVPKLKLVLSKDSLGQYSSGSSQKPHRQHSGVSGEKGSSRKRAFSPSEGSFHKHKLPRNDSSSRLLATGGDQSSAGSLSGSPSVMGQSMTPSKEHLEQTMIQLHQIIEQRQEQMLLNSQQRTTPSSGGGSSHRKHRHNNPTPPSDNPYSDIPQ